MVLRDVEQVRTGHSGDIGVQKLTRNLLTRHRHSRFEQTDIPDSRIAAIARDHTRVNAHHILHGQEPSVCHRVGLPSEPLEGGAEHPLDLGHVTIDLGITKAGIIAHDQHRTIERHEAHR